MASNNIVDILGRLEGEAGAGGPPGESPAEGEDSEAPPGGAGQEPGRQQPAERRQGGRGERGQEQVSCH